MLAVVLAFPKRDETEEETGGAIEEDGGETATVCVFDVIVAGLVVDVRR